MQKIGRYENKSCYKTRRSELRQHMTLAEVIVWKMVRNERMGVKFRRQYNIGHCIVDFYCHQLKLIIEIDGSVHEDDSNYKKDIFRQKFLENQGYKIIRFTNHQVKTNPEGVYYYIAEVVKNYGAIKSNLPGTDPLSVSP